MKLDLSALVTAVASFEQSIAVVSDKNWFNSQPKPVQNTLVAGVIQNFEFVYELSIKMLRRRLEMDAATPTETDFADFRDLVRTGAERGFVADVEAWFEYRKLRNITSHTYDQKKALEVLSETLKFVSDAKALLKALDARNV